MDCVGKHRERLRGEGEERVVKLYAYKVLDGRSVTRDVKFIQWMS